MYKRILVITGSQPWIDASVEYAIALAASTGAYLSSPHSASTPDRRRHARWHGVLCCRSGECRGAK